VKYGFGFWRDNEFLNFPSFFGIIFKF